MLSMRIRARKDCFLTDLKKCVLHPAERGGGGGKVAVKWSIITALAYEQVEGQRREGGRRAGQEERGWRVQQCHHPAGGVGVWGWRGYAGVEGWTAEGGGAGRRGEEGEEDCWSSLRSEWMSPVYTLNSVHRPRHALRRETVAQCLVSSAHFYKDISFPRVSPVGLIHIFCSRFWNIGSLHIYWRWMGFCL